MQSELTSTYDTDYKCEYKPRHYSEYLQLTPPSDWQTCLQRNVTLKRERTNAQHGCRFPARRGVSSPASAWVEVPSSQGCLACPDSPRVETVSDQKSTEILEPKPTRSRRNNRPKTCQKRCSRKSGGNPGKKSRASSLFPARMWTRVPLGNPPITISSYAEART